MTVGSSAAPDDHGTEHPNGFARSGQTTAAAAQTRRHWPRRRMVLSCATIVFASTLATLTAIGVASGPPEMTASSPVSAPRAEELSARDTCAAWRAESKRVDAAARALPDGWYWNATAGHAPITTFTATVGRQLDTFEQQIGAAPDEVSRAARTYLAAKRRELDELRSRTYDQGVGAAVSAARAALNTLCDHEGAMAGT